MSTLQRQYTAMSNVKNKDKKSREKKYSPEEIDVLVKCVYAEKKILFGNFDNSVCTNTEKRRNEIWTEISRKVSAVNPKVEYRSKDKLIDKFSYLKSDVKKKAARINDSKKTGMNDTEGVETLTHIDLLVLEMMGGKVAVEGEEEGADTFALNQNAVKPSVKRKRVCTVSQSATAQEDSTDTLLLSSILHDTNAVINEYVSTPPEDFFSGFDTGGFNDVPSLTHNDTQML